MTLPVSRARGLTAHLSTQVVRRRLASALRPTVGTGHHERSAQPDDGGARSLTGVSLTSLSSSSQAARSLTCRRHADGLTTSRPPDKLWHATETRAVRVVPSVGRQLGHRCGASWCAWGGCATSAGLQFSRGCPTSSAALCSAPAPRREDDGREDPHASRHLAEQYRFTEQERRATDGDHRLQAQQHRC